MRTVGDIAQNTDYEKLMIYDSEDGVYLFCMRRRRIVLVVLIIGLSV